MSEEIHPALVRLRTVCRCNNIKHGTIARTIESGAKSIAEVARATTATTGQCGGTCTPRVLEMIEAVWGGGCRPKACEAVEEDAWWVRR